MSGNLTPEERRERMVAGAYAMRAVDSYLRSINEQKPRGRRTNPEELQRKIDAEPNLAKKTILTARLHDAVNVRQTAEVEEDFIKHAKNFSERHDISYAVWREMGVSPEVLKKCGIR